MKHFDRTYFVYMAVTLGVALSALLMAALATPI